MINIRSIFYSLAGILVLGVVCAADDLILNGTIYLNDPSSIEWMDHNNIQNDPTGIEWMDYSDVQNINNRNNACSLAEFPLSISEHSKEYYNSSHYELGQSTTHFTLHALHSPHWLDDKHIIFLDMVDNVVKVKEFDLATRKESDILEHRIIDREQYTSVGAVLTWLPQYRNGALIIHKSFVSENIDGWSHIDNQTGEQFEIYLINLKRQKLERIGTITDKEFRSGPPVPNAFLHIRPQRDQILLEIQAIGYYLVDLKKKNVRQISVLVKNPEALDALHCSVYSSREPLIKIKAGSISRAFPKNMQWSKDGMKLGMRQGVLWVIDCPE